MRQRPPPVKHPKPPAKLKSPEDLPLKPALEELAFVRKAFHDGVAHYVARVDGQLSAIREAMSAIAAQKKVSKDRVRELRDILMILREVEVKPEKGRRRDLKKIESAVEDASQIVDGWE